MMSFNKLNFFQPKWALIVLIVYCISSGQCGLGTSKESDTPTSPTTSTKSKTKTEIETEFEPFIGNFLISLNSEQRQEMRIIQLYLGLFPIEYKKIILSTFRPEEYNAINAFGVALPKILEDVINRWVKSKGENWDLTGLSSLIKYNLDMISIWKILRPVLHQYLPDKENEKFILINQSFNKFLNDNVEHIHAYPKKVIVLTDLGKLAFTLAYAKQEEQNRLARLLDIEIKSEEDMVKDAVNEAKKKCEEHNFQFNYEHPNAKKN